MGFLTVQTIVNEATSITSQNSIRESVLRQKAIYDKASKRRQVAQSLLPEATLWNSMIAGDNFVDITDDSSSLDDSDLESSQMRAQKAIKNSVASEEAAKRLRAKLQRRVAKIVERSQINTQNRSQITHVNNTNNQDLIDSVNESGVIPFSVSGALQGESSTDKKQVFFSKEDNGNKTKFYVC